MKGIIYKYTSPSNKTYIGQICKGVVRFQNGYKKKCLTAHGYKWKYLEDVEGSTTTEMA